MGESTQVHDETVWRVRSLQTAYEWSGSLIARWEVSLDPVSDDYTPDEMSAANLFDRWLERVQKRHTGGLVPIHWFVTCGEQGKFERMPFQFSHDGVEQQEDFLSFFSWPVNAATGERLNWLRVPVADKGWNGQRADKGGFIQEVTGWKPAILQPFVYLTSLVAARA
jgi:hypothetical protein